MQFRRDGRRCIPTSSRSLEYQLLTHQHPIRPPPLAAASPRACGSWSATVTSMGSKGRRASSGKECLASRSSSSSSSSRSSSSSSSSSSSRMLASRRGVLKMWHLLERSVLLCVSLAVTGPAGQPSKRQGRWKYALCGNSRIVQSKPSSGQAGARQTQRNAPRFEARYWQGRQACTSPQLAHSSTTPEGTSPPCIDSSAWLLQHHGGMVRRRGCWCGTSGCCRHRCMHNVQPISLCAHGPQARAPQHCTPSPCCRCSSRCHPCSCGSSSSLT